MKIIKSSFEIEDFDGERMLKSIEKAGRTCYKSEDKITDDSAKKFVSMLINDRKHESVIEHEKITVRFIFDRGVSHELVRHRIGSYSQESTRFCAYNKDKFGNRITLIDIRQHFTNPESLDLWFNHMFECERVYFKLLENGEKPEIARSVLPNSLKTEIVATFNLREWRLVFKLRTSPKAHPQMREVMVPLLAEMKKRLPVVFDDIFTDEDVQRKMIVGVEFDGGK